MNWISSLWSSKSDQIHTNSGAPDRAQRKACWDTRDAYFTCLDTLGVLKPGQEPNNACLKEKRNYEGTCAKSWIDYFNTRRVLQEEQKDQLRMAEAQANAARNKKI